MDESRRGIVMKNQSRCQPKGAVAADSAKCEKRANDTKSEEDHTMKNNNWNAIKEAKTLFADAERSARERARRDFPWQDEDENCRGAILANKSF